jgi:hypothetical protein
MTSDTLVNLIVQLAKEIDLEDPIYWDMLEIDEDATWHMMACNVVEMFRLESESDKLILLATVTKLVVENFVLQAQLMKIRMNT